MLRIARDKKSLEIARLLRDNNASSHKFISEDGVDTNYDIHSLWQPPHDFRHHEDGVDISGDARHEWRVHRRSPKVAEGLVHRVERVPQDANCLAVAWAEGVGIEDVLHRSRSRSRGWSRSRGRSRGRRRR